MTAEMYECSDSDSPVQRTWKVFAFNKTNGREDRRQGIPGWKLAEALEWAMRYDTILLELGDDPPSSSVLSTHHLCADSRCPGGCE